MIPTTKPALSWKECQDLLSTITLQLRYEFPAYGFSAGKIGTRLNLSMEPIGPIWGSIFVTTIANIQIGRLIFRDGSFSHSKVYGEKMFCPKRLIRDKIWSLLEGFTKTLETMMIAQKLVDEAKEKGITISRVNIEGLKE